MLRKFLLSADLEDGDKSIVGSFLSAGQSTDYAPQSGQIIGILKQMKDSMSASLADATEQEGEAIKDYEALIAAKTKEVNACFSSTRLFRLFRGVYSLAKPFAA